MQLVDKTKVEIVNASTGALLNIERTPQSAVVSIAPAGAKRGASGKGAANVFLDSNEQHIMISYDWNHKEPVRKMCRVLQNLGYRTWLDVDNMRKHL